VAGAVAERADAATGAPRAEPPSTDWTLRGFANARTPLLWIGVVFAAAFLVASLVIRIGLGEFTLRFWSSPYFWLDVLNSALFAYAPVATTSLRRGRLRDLHELRSVLRGDEASFARLEADTVSVPPRRLAASGLIGALLIGTMPALDPSFWPGGRPENPLDPMMLFFVIRSAATGWLFGHAAATDVTGVVALRRLGAHSLQVDLLNPGALAPFARAGLRSAFVWVLASSLISLFWLGPAAGTANAVIVACILLAVSVGFFFTIYGAHQSLVAAKRKSLEALNEQIRESGSRLLEGRGVDGSPALADLIAFHGFIERVREWPIGAPTLARGGLIAALALGSWLGGALVERLLERAF
jgi:hypothetical protein